MLPVAFQFLIAMIGYAINERMARRLDYVQEEVRVLKEALLNATGKNRIAFTVEQRQRLAIKGKALTSDEREGCCQLVRSATSRGGFASLWRNPTTAPRSEPRAGLASRTSCASPCFDSPTKTLAGLARNDRAPLQSATCQMMRWPCCRRFPGSSAPAEVIPSGWS
jgi:hypothetical protein